MNGGGVGPRLRRRLRRSPLPVRILVSGGTFLRTVTMSGERGRHPPPGHGRYPREAT